MNKTPPAQWRWIALAFCLIMLGQYAFYLPDLLSSRPPIIQDDGRHFVAWLRKLADPALPDAKLIDAMVENPILIERPIAIAGKRAVVGRPPEKVLEVL